MTQPGEMNEAAALEQARAGLEAALSGNEHWRALRLAAGEAERTVHERALAGNPLYKSWKVMTEALEGLRAHSKAEADADELAPDPESDAPGDDLTRIRGISAGLAGRLDELGIRRFGQIAAWRSGDVRRVSEALGLGKAVSRQNWIEQAALLGRHTSAVPTPAAPTEAHADRQAGAPPPRAAAAAPPLGVQAIAHPSAVDEAAAPWQPQDDDEKKEPEDTIDLPHILARIRSDAESRDGTAPAVDLGESNQHEEVEAHEAPADPDRDSAAASRPVAEPESEPAAEPEPEAPTAQATMMPAPAPTPPSPRSPIPTVAASSHINTDATERAKRLEDDRKHLSEQAMLEEEEATVTFVIREPAEPDAGDSFTLRRDTARTPTHLAGRRPEPVEPFTPPSSDAGEAEVVIVSTEVVAPKGRQPGSVRRFLKALTGN